MSTMDFSTAAATQLDGDASTASAFSSQSSPDVFTIPKVSPDLDLQCGIFSKTVVESPVANTILPVRMRSNSQKDLAFVGDHYVQISELEKDGQIHEVLRKNDFRARIRNAAVLGNFAEQGSDDYPSLARIKIEDVDVSMQEKQSSTDTSAECHVLPPQILVLILENADILFLFMKKTADGTHKFVIHSIPCGTRVPYMGYHFTIDPTSRCLAVGSPEGYVLIYELETMDAISTAYAHDGTFAPIRRKHTQAVHDLIHKMEFLYPRPQDNFNFILLFVLIRRDGRATHDDGRSSRMMSFEWVIGDDLCRIFSEEKSGIRLTPEHAMPLLIIPLKFRRSFLTVSATEIGMLKNTVEGSPDIEFMPTNSPDATAQHHGLYEPLWTAWVRPFRRQSYFEKTDVIYVAREDGVIIHVEIDCNTFVPSVTNVGCLSTNINTAFATSYDMFSDVLIIGGDAGPGGVWKLAPRTDIEKIGIIPNWSAVVDATTMNATSVWNFDTNTPKRDATRQRPTVDASLRRPESIYTVSGRGINGSATEWRWGIQGRVGLDLEVPLGPSRVWLFKAESLGLPGWLSIISSPHSSAILNLEENFLSAQDLSEVDNGFDDTSRTLLAQQVSDSTIVQITETTISVVSPSTKKQYTFAELIKRPDARAYQAFLVGDTIVFSTHHEESSMIHLVQTSIDGASMISSWETAGYVTAVTAFAAGSTRFVAAALTVSGSAWLCVYPVDGTDPIVNTGLDNRSTADEQGSDASEFQTLEPVTSIIVVRQSKGAIDLAMGTRCGHLINAKVVEDVSGHLTWHCETLGISSVDLFQVNDMFNGSPAVFACCDGRLIMLHQFHEARGRFMEKNYLLLTDSQNDSVPSPDIQSAFQMRENLTGYSGHLTVAVVSANKILVCDVWPHVGLVPRSISLKGTPSRITYSHIWKCLIVSTVQDNKPTLYLIDPSTGSIISRPTDKNKMPADCISGLGHDGDRVYGITEWHYVKEGRTFSFILIGTKQGRLLVVSLTASDQERDDMSGRSVLHCWTRHKITQNGPIFAVVGDDEGIVYCADTVIHRDVLDLGNRRLRTVNKYELDSPATTLSIRDDKLYAVTATQSLVVLDHRSDNGNGDMTLLHTDEVSRPTTHLIQLGDPDQQQGNWPITMLSDQVGRFSGVALPSDGSFELQTLFEGALTTSIRRFTHARTRPPWLAGHASRRFGTLPSDKGGVEIFGLGMDGSLHVFTLLSRPLWRFLSLVQNLIYLDQEHFPLIVPRLQMDMIPEDDSSALVTLRPKTAHIDGDVLERCVQEGKLRTLVEDAGMIGEMCRSLEGLDDGKWTQGIKESSTDRESKIRRYFEVANRILEYMVERAI